MQRVASAFPAFLASAAGVGLYFLGSRNTWAAAITILVVAVGISYIALRAGVVSLRTDPTEGVWLISVWVVGLIALGAGITALLIYAGVHIARALTTLSKPEADALFSPIMGSLTTLTAALFLKDLRQGSGDIWPSEITRKEVARAFTNVFDADTAPYEAVYEDHVHATHDTPEVQGWGFRARLSRGKLIRDAL